jgi:hypothetical protein
MMREFMDAFMTIFLFAIVFAPLLYAKHIWDEHDRGMAELRAKREARHLDDDWSSYDPETRKAIALGIQAEVMMEFMRDMYEREIEHEKAILRARAKAKADDGVIDADYEVVDQKYLPPA